VLIHEYLREDDIMLDARESFISVERVAKPLKNKVAEKGRKRNSTAKCALLLRVGVNFLRLRKESLKSVKAALGKLDPDDPLVFE
jgi:preprotein translocase subunit SecD